LYAAAALHGPLLFPIERGGEPQSLESRLRAALENFPLNAVRSNAEHAEHLSIVKRWYYRSHRAGEIFFAEESGLCPFPRIVRGVGRVYKGEKQEEFSATQLPDLPSQPA